MLRNNSVADINSANLITTNSNTMSTTTTSGKQSNLTSASSQNLSLNVSNSATITTSTTIPATTTITTTLPNLSNDSKSNVTDNVKSFSAASVRSCLNYVESTRISSNAFGPQKQRLNELMTLISDQEKKLNRLKAIHELAKEQATVNAELTSELKTVNNTIIKKDAELRETLARVDNLNRQLNNYRRTRAYRNSKNVTASKKSIELERDISEKPSYDKKNGEIDENCTVQRKKNDHSHNSSANGHTKSHDKGDTLAIETCSDELSSPSTRFPTFASEFPQNATISDTNQVLVTDSLHSVSEQAVITSHQDLKQIKQVDSKKKDDNHQTNSSSANSSTSQSKLSGTHHQSPAINKYTSARQKLMGSSLKNGRRVSFDPLALLLDAALEGELDLVIQTSKQVPDLSASHDECVTALHNAVVAGHYEVAKYLIEAGCDINVQDSDGWTPLHCAASCNELALVKLLIENGALIYATTSSDDSTPAMKCDKNEKGFEDCYKYLTFVQNNLGIIHNGVVYALYDYNAQEEDELSFVTGEELVILRRDDSQEQEWWWAQQRIQLTSDTREGYIPRNLVGLYPRVKKSGKLNFNNSNGS